MTWFFVFMTVFGWRVSPITGSTANVTQACYGSGQSEFCIVEAYNEKDAIEFINPEL